jgi:NADH-quinone oxidoreductase subunit L
LIGAIAIAGVPGFAGFFSKDEILFRAFAGGHTLLWMIGLLTSLLTAIYMFRLVFLAFHGPEHSSTLAPEHPSTVAPKHSKHLHDAPPAMAIALVVLAIGSVVAGYVSLGGRFERFLEPSFSPQTTAGVVEGPETLLMIVSSIVALVGIGIAAALFLTNKSRADRIAERFSGVRELLVNKYYVDEIYDAAVVQPIRIVSQEALWRVVDVKVIDGAVNGVGETVSGGSEILRRLQTGSVRAYAAFLFVGVVLILGYYLWR